MTNLIIVGPAGSGKSTLTKAFGEWLKGDGYTVNYLNLDPLVQKACLTPPPTMLGTS